MQEASDVFSISVLKKLMLKVLSISVWKKKQILTEGERYDH